VSKEKLEEPVGRVPYILDMQSSKVSPWATVLTEKFTDEEWIGQARQL
jgi:hypothetical protein